MGAGRVRVGGEYRGSAGPRSAGWWSCLPITPAGSLVPGRQKAVSGSRYDVGRLAAVAQWRRSRLRICGP